MDLKFINDFFKNNPLALAGLYVILAPVLGGLLAGFDRIISARMQRRVGPPLFQPFFDFFKLISKKSVTVNGLQYPFVLCHLFFMIMTGFLFFYGSDILLIIFVLTVASIFFVLAAYSANSPFSFVGAERELLLMMAYEPMVLIALVAIFKVVGSFSFFDIVGSNKPLILYLPGVFLGFFFILTMKFRKSPFDLSYSHHGHQELVKGITTDLSGKTLAIIEISHWYENIFLLGFIFLFFGFNLVFGIIAVLFCYFLEILIDNVYARFKWELAFKSAWIVTLVLGGGNLLVLYLLK